MKNNIFLIRNSIVILTILIQCFKSKDCPKIQTYHNPQFQDGFVVKSFLKIPKTNIVLINTIYEDRFDSSIVYYNDLSTSSGEIVNVVKPDYVIIDFGYIPQTDKILITNYEMIAFVDPYTLKSEKSIPIQKTKTVLILPNTKYAILTNYIYLINILDVLEAKVVQTLDNRIYPNYEYYQSFSYYYTFNNGDQAILTTSQLGIYSWNFDFNTLSNSYNGYLPETLLNNPNYRRPFLKHPTLDIIFMGGQDLEVTALKINDIKTGDVTVLFREYYGGIDGDKIIKNIMLAFITLDGVQQPILWFGEEKYFYQVQLNISDDGSSISLDPQYYYFEQPHTYEWYPLQESTIILIPQKSGVCLFDYKSGLFNFNLFFKSDGKTKRFMRSQDGLDLYIIIQDYNIYLFQRGNLGYFYKEQKPALSKLMRYQFNSAYRVKDCPESECLFLKAGQNQDTNQDTHDYILTTLIYPFETKDLAVDITALFGLRWDNTNLNLDPFYLNDTVWVVLAVLKKSQSEEDHYLFQLINAKAKSEKERYFLKSTIPEDNLKQASFALASIEDKTNLEIIGVDTTGTVYVWDLNIEKLDFKYSIKFSSCQNSIIGDIFHSEKLKRLIITCGDFTVYSFDFIKGEAQQLVKLTYHPLSLKAFSGPSIVAVGDRFTGDAYIYKFNKDLLLFEFFLKITTGKFKDLLLSIELLKDNTLWIQYNYNCIEDKNACTQCTQSYDFKATDQSNEKGIYGEGTTNSPFTTSANFFTAMIKAQYYKELISGVSNMNVDIIVEPNLIMKLQPGLLNFDFNSVISLTFKSKFQGELASLQFKNQFKLQNYNFIRFQDILIMFDFDKNKQQCGLSFIDIPQVILNNIKLKSINAATLSCQQIFVQNSLLQILNYDIQDEDFSQNSSLISTFNSTKIDIKNLSLKNSILGEKFNILNQLTDLNANIETVYIKNNKCSTPNQDNEIISSLFSAGLFTVKDIHITGNKFCKKVIFSTVTLLQHTNQIFDFQDIEVIDNIFQTRTNYIFFNSLYSMRSNPSHVLLLTKFNFVNNNLNKEFQDDLQIASFIQTNKISKLIINNAIIYNHFDIQFGLFEYAKEVTINNFQCSNDNSYNENIKENITIGCIQLNEINQVSVNTIGIQNKKANDNPLFMMENYIVKNAFLTLNKGPFYIGSSYQIAITLDGCNFKNNILVGITNSLTSSTTALWIENYVGQVIIKNSHFENSFSNSIYGFMYIQSYEVKIENVIFKKSTFLTSNESTKKEMFLQKGGMMNLKVQTTSIIDSSFSQATAQVGSFIYFQSFGDELKVDIQNTHFEEGYAKIDGGCLFIDTSGTNLIFNCIDCYFNNLYSFNPKASVIGMEKYQKTSEKTNIVNFKGGNIINTFGSEDNYFIEITHTQIKFSDISQIQSQDFDSKISLAHKEYQKIKNQQQSTMLNLISSTADIINCTIKNLKISNQSSTLPLLINSQNSQINFDNTSVQDCAFATSAINSSSSSTITFKKTKFLNVNKINNSRILDISEDSQPNLQATSLIIISNGALKVEQDSQFQNINCSNNCNGGVFQLLNSNFFIKDTIINNTKAIFGGSIFILGIKDDNLIQNTSINGGKSQNDGGAIYLHSTSSDKFKLIIDGSKFLNNEAIDGKGGAIIISSEVLNSPIQSIILSNSIISGNKAQIAGGLQQSSISVDIKDSKIENNFGEIFGNDEISYPSHLRLSNLNEFLTSNPNAKVENDVIVIDNFRSGAKLYNLIFEFLSDKNEKVVPITKADFNSYSISARFDPTITNKDSFFINSETTISYNRTLNSFSFRELELIGTPLSTTILQFRSDKIKVLNKKTNFYDQNYEFQIKINFRNCTQGEQKTDYNGQTLCKICDPGFYSYFVDTCQECHEGAICNGGADVKTKEGFWRKTNESNLIIKCSNLLENCAGGSYGDKICYEGHIGALCEECDIYGEYWGSSYSKSAKFQCQKCDEIKNNLWIVALLTLWTLISMTFAIKGGIESVKEKAAALALQKNLQRKSVSQKYKKERSESMSKRIYQIHRKKEKVVSSDSEKSGIFIKMFTNYLQIVGSIATFNLQIPSGIFEFPQSVGEPLRQTMNSLDCALKDLDVSIPIIYLRLIFSLFIPFLYMILFLIGISIFSIIKREKKFPWYILSTAIMFLIIYVQPDLVAQIIALMSCRVVGETNYILSNVSFECYTDQHLFYILVLIAPLLLVWVFILPIILFLMLRKNKSELNSIEIKLKYGFLYREYKNYAFYWEFIKMAEKITIILCLNFYSQSIPTKAVLVFIIIVIYGILSLLIEPYQESDVNQIDVNSTNVCAITVLLGLFLYNNPYNYYIYISLALIVLINIWFIVRILKKIIGGYTPMIEETVMSIIEKLSQKVSYFQKFVKTKKVKRINPELKKKVQNIFYSFTKMKGKEKKALVIKIIDYQLGKNYDHIFHDEQDSLIELKKEYFQSSNQINKPHQDTPSTLLMIEQLPVIQKDNWQLDNQNNIPTSVKMETAPTLFGKNNRNQQHFQLDSEPDHLLKNESLQIENKQSDSNLNDNIKQDDILISFKDLRKEN